MLENELRILKEEYRKLQEHLEHRCSSTCNMSSSSDRDDEGNKFDYNLKMVVADLFNKPLYSDVVILLGNGHQLCGHKLILSSRSLNWGVADLHLTDCLDFTGIRYDVVYAMMKWVYTDDVDITVEDTFLIELLHVAIRFKLKSLNIRCQNALISSVNSENCEMLYKTSEEMAAELLKSACLEFSCKQKVCLPPQIEERKTRSKFVTEESNIMTFHQCPFCDQSFLEYSQLEQHTKSHFEKEIKSIDYCKKLNPAISDSESKLLPINLRNSQKQVRKVREPHHVEENLNPKISDMEEIHNASITSSINKLRTNKSYKCDVCCKTFSQSSHLKIHIRIHTGLKPCQCEICGRSFTQSSGLQAHMRIHSGEKPYKCDVCSKTFSQSSSLQKHISIHTGDRPFQCEICGVSFSLSSHLKPHIRIHSGERPYKCDVCDKTFNRCGHLIRHKRSHSGEKPYKCDVCSRSFIASGNLHRHMKTHNKSIS